MSSNSSGYRVRRQLSFQDVPYRGKLFYVDIKLQSLKQKIVQRIHDLGGQIESFLSKELDVILIDGDENKKTTTNFNKLQNIPLSRGQALLNASTDNKGDGSSKKNDIIHRASLLGVKTQTAKEFVQVTAKAISKIKLQKKVQQKENDFLQGMSPITWDKDKENCYFLKVEDNAQCYRPLFKQLETVPKIAYNETGSPFDVGIVLTRQSDGNKSKKKIIKAAPKGGYCESCDHWYKGILKEHLKSTKHLAFISSKANFKSLEIISAGLPGLDTFLRKFDPDSDSKKVGEIEGTRMIGELQHLETFCQDDHSASKQDVINSVDTFSHFIYENETESKEKTESDKDRSTCYPSSIPLPTLIGKESVQSSTFTKGIASNTLLQDNLSDRYIGSEGLKISTSETNLTTTVMSLCNTSEFKQDSDNIKNQANGIVQTNQTAHVPVSDKLPISSLTFNNNFVPEANFSSSSCSFGDHGVANVLTFLQSNDSEVRSTKQQSGRQSAETILTEKSQHSRESCIVKGSIISFESVSSKEILGAPLSIEQFVKNSSEQDFGNMMTVSCENQSANGTYSEAKRGFEQNQEFPYSNCDTFKFEQKLHTKTSLITTNPDYSNITEESISSEIPKVVNFKSIQKDQTSKVDTNQTPSKVENEELRDEMMKNVANSGGTWSSIRNWLLPADEVDHADQPCQDLDKTLVTNDSQVPQAINLTAKSKCDISNIFNENSAESSNNFVAAWIKNQKFEVSGESDISLHSFVAEAQPADSNNNINSVFKTSALEDKESIHVNEAGQMLDVIKPIQIDNETTLKNDIESEGIKSDYLSDDLSDCTSISDCTLENFRINPLETLNNIEAAKKEEFDDKFDKETKDSECMSQKSSISCQLTDKGIKIKGLLSFKQADGESSAPNKRAQQPCVGNGDKTDVCIPIGGPSLSRYDVPMKDSSLPISDLPVTCKQAPKVSSENAHSSQKCATPSHQSLDNDFRCKDIGQNAIKNHTKSQALLPSTDCKTDKNFQYQTLKTVETLQCSYPKSSDTLDNSLHSYNPYSPMSQPLQVGSVEKRDSCMQNSLNQAQPMVSSPMMNDCRFSAKGNIPNRTEKQCIGASMPGGIKHTVNQTNIPGNMQHTVNQANIPVSMQQTVNQTNMPRNIQHTANQANFQGSMQQTVNQTNMPDNMQQTVNQANIPGRMQHTVNQVNMHGSVQHTVNPANFQGSKQHTVNQASMQWDYFNTGILPYETQCAKPYSNNMGSFPSEVHQSFPSSSYYMSSMTDYLAVSSPRHDSTSSQQYMCVNQGSTQGTSLNSSNIQGQYVQSIQYPLHKLSGGLPDRATPSSACNSKPTAAKKNSRKTEKRKRNDSQPSFLSSTSSFCANNSNQLSHCGFSSGMVEPTLSLQSDWYPSSPQSAVSSAGLSTIRTEDIAEGTCQYNYYKTAVPKKRKLTEANVAYQHHRDSAIVNSSTPNSQGYHSPHSAMYEGNYSSMVYPHLTNVAPCSSPFNQVPQQMSQLFPSHLPQQPSPYIAGISQPTMSGANHVTHVTNNSFAYHTSTPNGFPTCSPVLAKHMFHSVNSNFDSRNCVQLNVQEDKTKQATSRCVYNAEQTGETRLKLRKVPVSRPEQQNDLKNYWNVRKAGDCRLVFSSQIGKRKASEETPYIKDADFVRNGDSDDYYNQAKKRRCLVY